MKKVGIIGGSGFIGSYNTRKFLEKCYKVKVSATDISKEDKYEHLKRLPNAENLEVEQLDVLDKEQLERFLKGCNIVIHGGTPFQLDVKDPENELFKPTINGTKNFLEAAQNSPDLEKVVFIASVAAYNTNFPLPPGEGDKKQVSEADEPFMSEESHPYAQAKFLANQTVREFVDNNPDPGFEISSVSPVSVMGKSMSGRQDSTSTGLQFLFKNKISPNAFIQMIYDRDVEFAIIDVEDVAEAVYRAATTKGLHGKNYLLSSESYKVSDINLMLNDKEPKNHGRIFYSCELAKDELEVEFIPAKESLKRFEG